MQYIYIYIYTYIYCILMILYIIRVRVLSGHDMGGVGSMVLGCLRYRPCRRIRGCWMPQIDVGIAKPPGRCRMCVGPALSGKTWSLPRLRVHAQPLPQAVHPHRQGYSSTCSCGFNARCRACGLVAQSSLTTRRRQVMCWSLLVAS